MGKWIIKHSLRIQIWRMSFLSHSGVFVPDEPLGRCRPSLANCVNSGFARWGLKNY